MGKMIGAGWGWEWILCLFMEGSNSKVSSGRLPAGAPPGSRGKCPALRQAGRQQKHLLHTIQHVLLPLSHQSPHSVCSCLYPAESLMWCFDKPTVCSALLQQECSSFGEDQEACCRRILEKQACASEGKAGSWPRVQSTMRRPDVCALADVPSWLKLGIWDIRSAGGTWQVCRGQQAASTEWQWPPFAAEVSGAVIWTVCEQWLDKR